MRIVFMGTPDFAVPTLDRLAGEGHEIAAVYTQPPRPAGRGKKDRPSPVQARAERLGFEVRSPASLKGPEEQARFAALKADVAVVAAYGLILPQAVLDAPDGGCFNVHASLLPRWRGAAPIHRAIMAGDAETGVCIMGMEAGLDTGPVFAREAIPIGPHEVTGELTAKLAALGARLMARALPRLGELEPEPQPEDGVTYAAKIDKAEAEADWSKGAAEVARHVNGLSPFPGAWTTFEGKRLKLLRARPGAWEGDPDARSGHVGTPTGDTVPVRCPGGAAHLIEVQPEGRPRQRAVDWLRGREGAQGAVLGG